MAEGKRARKPNFSEREVNILLEQIAIEKNVLNSTLTTKVMNKRKQAIWQEIARKVSTCGVACRTVVELKDKWGLLKRATAQKKNDAKKTGGGKGMPPPIYENAVVAILEDNSTLMSGIEEVKGTESFPAMKVEEVDQKTSQPIPVGEDSSAASRQPAAAAAAATLEVCDNVVVLNSALGVEGNAIASGEDSTTLSTASRPQPPSPAPVTLESCGDTMVFNNSGLSVGGKEPSLPDAASTPQSLSRWKNLHKQRTKRRFQQTAAADELLDEFLKNQVEDSKRRQRKMDLEIMILESTTVNLQSLTEREKELDVKRKELELRKTELELRKAELELRKTELEVKLLEAKVANELGATSTMHGD